MKISDNDNRDLSCFYRFMKSASIFVGVVALLQGCQQPEDKFLDLMPVSYKERHPIQVSHHSKEITLTLSDGPSGLTRYQVNKLKAFLISYKRNGYGAISIEYPSGTSQPELMKSAIGSIKNTSSSVGLAPRYLDFFAHKSDLVNDSIIRLRYRYSRAHAEKCGEWPVNLAENYTNLHYYNFGCSQQRNFAAMLANPNDLAQPRNLDNRAGERRDVIWDKYIKGETTVSNKSSEEKGAVSEVAKQ